MGIGQPVLRLYPPKSWLLSVQTNQNFPTLKTAVPVSCLVSAQKIQAKKNFFFFFGCVCRKLRHADQRSRLFLLRTTSDPALKKEHFRPKLVFSIFPAKILSRRSRLLQTTRDATRLNRPRPIDCDHESEQTVKIVVNEQRCEIPSYRLKDETARHGIPVTQKHICCLRREPWTT